MTPEVRATISLNSLNIDEHLAERRSLHGNMYITDRKISEEFKRISRVVALPLFYRLTFPRDLSLLPTVQEVILENLSEG